MTSIKPTLASTGTTIFSKFPRLVKNESAETKSSPSAPNPSLTTEELLAVSKSTSNEEEEEEEEEVVAVVAVVVVVVVT